MTAAPRLDFAIVGAPKCGTTALAEYLDQLDGIQLSRPKEPHWFDAYYTAGTDGFAEYHRRAFGSAPVAGLLGEATPTTLDIPWAGPRLAQHASTVRVVALLRDPLERAASQWRMLHARGIERRSYPQAMRDALAAFGRDDLDEDGWQRVVDAFRHGRPVDYPRYLEHGRYAHHLARLATAIPRERILVARIGDLGRDPAGFTVAVARFLGHPGATAPTDTARRNEAYGARADALFRVARALRLTELAPRLPQRWKARIKARLAAAPNERRAQRPELDPQLADEVRAALADDQRALAAWFPSTEVMTEGTSGAGAGPPPPAGAP